MTARLEWVLHAVLVLGALGCVDPGARYDAFLERTADMRGIDSGMVEQGDRFDWSGQYLLALSTTLAPDKPLLFTVEAEVAGDLSSASLAFQPLTTDDDDEPRTEIGDAFSIEDIVYEEDGTFSADLGEVAVPGRANPITGSDIVAQVQLMARTQADEAGVDHVFCGQVTGMVTEPLPLDLEGSSFGALLGEDVQDVEPLLRCP